MLIDFGLRAEYKVSIVNSADVLGTCSAIYSDVGPCKPSTNDQLLRIEPPSSSAWFFKLDEIGVQNKADGIYACPSLNHLLVVVDYYAYYIDSRTPGDIRVLPGIVLKVHNALHLNRLFLIGVGTIVAIGEQGFLWESPRLSPEDLCILAVEEDIIFGHGDLSFEEENEFKISSVDGTLIQGNSYTAGKTFDIDGDINAIKDYFTRTEYSWEIAAPADKKTLAKIKLPLKKFAAPYWEFLRLCNGGEGVIPVSPGYFLLWSAEELEESNKLLQSELTGLYAFGSSGGGCYYVFDMKEINSPVYKTDACAIGDPDGTEKVAETFHEFLQLFGTGEWGSEPDWS